MRPPGEGPPGGRHDEGGPRGPAAAERVVPTPPITNTASRHPTAGADLESKGIGRREGGRHQGSGDPAMCDKSRTRRLVDWRRATCLCDVGAPDYVATVAVGVNGELTLWLVRKELLGQAGADHGNENPPHEKLGRLPQAVRDRIWGDSLRCGRPTSSGRPCRIRVANPGDPCGTHAKPRCDGCGQIMLKQGGVWGCFGCHPDRYWTPVEAPS